MATISLEPNGITAAGEVMQNGEMRFRMMADDGSGYIRTEAGVDGAWQNAHYHKGVMETYIIQSGQMAFATMTEEGQACVMVYGPGDVISSQPGEAHNVYLYGYAVIHTVKHGVPIGNPRKDGADWFPAAAVFDKWTKFLTEGAIEGHHQEQTWEQLLL